MSPPFQILRVRIEAHALESLQKDKLNLCPTRGMIFDGEPFSGNVVYKMVSYDQLSTGVEMKWDDKFEVFETDVFELNNPVKFNIDAGGVQYGQTVIFKDNSQFNIIGDPEPGKPIYVQNYWRSRARLGVKTVNSSPFFVSDPRVNGSWDTLNRGTEFGVFWNADLVPGTAFNNDLIKPFYFPVKEDEPEVRISYQSKPPYWRSHPS